MRAGFYFLFLFGSFSAQAAVTCWSQESNPATGAPYLTEAAWDQDVNSWTEKEVPGPNPLRLKLAYDVYVKERAKAEKMANDKVGHCYIGCKIGAKTGLTTVKFVAWYKEYQDLTDCKLNTHFELKDFEATLFGGQLSPSDICEKSCLEKFGR